MSDNIPGLSDDLAMAINSLSTRAIGVSQGKFYFTRDETCNRRTGVFPEDELFDRPKR